MSENKKENELETTEEKEEVKPVKLTKEIIEERVKKELNINNTWCSSRPYVQTVLNFHRKLLHTPTLSSDRLTPDCFMFIVGEPSDTLDTIIETIKTIEEDAQKKLKKRQQEVEKIREMQELQDKEYEMKFLDLLSIVDLLIDDATKYRITKYTKSVGSLVWNRKNKSFEINYNDNEGVILNFEHTRGLVLEEIEELLNNGVYTKSRIHQLSRKTY